MVVHHKGGEAVDMTTISNMLLRTCYCVCYTTVSKNKMPLWRTLTILMAIFLKLEKNIDRKFFSSHVAHIKMSIYSSLWLLLILLQNIWLFGLTLYLWGREDFLVRSWKISLILCHFKFVGKTKHVILPSKKAFA